MKELGRLRIVNVRDVWALEPQHFSAWLAENIEQLGHAIGIELELRGREVGVGSFSLDMLAHDVDRNRIVIVENQLGKTDHDHLGKLVTYAAGTKADVIVWIAPEFREEHRAAIDWLNNNTDQSKEFFAIEIQALQIDDSRPAANFRLVSFPNDWQKIITASSQRKANDSGSAFFLEYYSELSAAARLAGFPRAQAPSGQAELVLDRLAAGAYIAAAFSRTQLTLGLFIARNNALENRRVYEHLRLGEHEISAKIGLDLIWDLKEDRIRQQIWTAFQVDRADPEQLLASQRWAIETATRFKAAFEPRLKAILQTGSADP